METNELKIVPALEIVRFGEVDIVRTSLQKDELPSTPGGYFKL
jgi:hypothetical protein